MAEIFNIDCYGIFFSMINISTAKILSDSFHYFCFLIFPQKSGGGWGWVEEFDLLSSHLCSYCGSDEGKQPHRCPYLELGPGEERFHVLFCLLSACSLVVLIAVTNGSDSPFSPKIMTHHYKAAETGKENISLRSTNRELKMKT